PRGETEHRLGARGTRLPRHASGAAGDARCAEPAAGPVAEPAHGPGGRGSAHPGPGLPVTDGGADPVRRAGWLTPERSSRERLRFGRLLLGSVSGSEPVSVLRPSALQVSGLPGIPVR